MIVGIGIDLIEIERVRAIHARHPERFSNRVLTDAEKSYVFAHADPTQRLAGRFAAKEAAVKALGVGIAEGLRWKDVEVLPDALGKPVLNLYGNAAQRAQSLGATIFHVTITHSESLAMAQVILEKV
jgi:holo-[acyl-carrier protein] synthase